MEHERKARGVPQCVGYWLFELGQGGWDANVVAQQVQRGDEVTPLDQFSQWPAAEGVLCDLEAGLFSQEAQVNQDLKERGEIFRILVLRTPQQHQTHAGRFFRSWREHSVPQQEQEVTSAFLIVDSQPQSQSKLVKD